MAQARIVVVEDDEIISEHLQKLLRELDYEIPATASTGEQALAAVETTAPDLVLMDIILKGPMDGIEAAEHIRTRFRVPVIYITAYSDDAILDRAKTTEPFGYLLKPFRKEALKTAVAMALFKSSMEKRLRESESRYKELSELLRHAKDELELRVVERTAELEESNTRLRGEIEHRTRAEEAARKSEQLFRAVFESAGDCIYIKDLSLRYSLINPVMASLLEIREQDIIGRTDRQIFGKEAAAHLTEVDNRVLKGETIEEEHTRPVKGVNLTFLDVKVPLRDGRAQIIGLCGISRNITERKKVVPVPAAIETDYPSAAMKETLEWAGQAARTDTIVLLLGESGSGKDYLARWIHQRSARANGPFYAMNCAALPHDLAESELFGHESGAFTGARGRVRGMLELAEGGTLLLNEIGELSPQLQAKLLTFLDTRTFSRLGGRDTIKVNARLMAATNRDIAEEVRQGRFRTDLFHRLNVLSITVPPLRDRSEDIPILALRTITELAAELQLPSVPHVTREDLERLREYSWPGNVRELRNVLERGLILSRGKDLRLESPGKQEPEKNQWTRTITFPPAEPFTEVVSKLRVDLIQEALRVSDGNKVQAARLLGISRYTLRRQMKSLGM